MSVISTVSIQHTQSPDPLNSPRAPTTRGKVRTFINFLLGLIGGSKAGLGNQPQTVVIGTARAVGTIALSSASGTLTATINGVDITSSGAGTDAADATAMVAAILASTNALVAKCVQASNLAGTIALSSAAAGTVLDLFGYQLRATAAASGLVGEFSVSGSNTQDGDALAACINAYPGLNELVYATNSSGTVTIRAFGPASSLGGNNLMSVVSGGSGFTVATSLAAVATVLISSLVKGRWGNMTTLAASGTGATASGARLTGGADTTVVY